MGKVPGGPGGRRPGSGRPAVKHGGYSIMVRAGDIPQRRSYLRAYLSEARAGLIRDLGPTETDLTTAQLILCDRIISKLSILRCVEEHVREKGIFKRRGEFVPILDRYLSWSNSIRADLQTLGIDKRAGEDILDLGAYIQAKDAAKSETSGGGGGTIDAPARDGGQIRGVGEGAQPDQAGEAAGELEDPDPGEVEHG